MAQAYITKNHYKVMEQLPLSTMHQTLGCAPDVAGCLCQASSAIDLSRHLRMTLCSIQEKLRRLETCIGLPQHQVPALELLPDMPLNHMPPSFPLAATICWAFQRINRRMELRLGAIARRLLQEEVTVAPQQYYPPPGAMCCYKITEAEMTSGKLCTSQVLYSNVTKVVCQEFKPECVTSVVEGRLLVPKGDARSNPGEFQQSSEAACKLLGYK
jgi:hypothetical protein